MTVPFYLIVPKCEFMLNYAKMKARYAVNYEFQICSKGKKMLIIRSRIKFIANILKVSL